MAEFFKKNKFMWWICAFLAIACLIFIYDSNKNRVQGKTVNGEDIVMEVDGKDYTTSSFYDEMYKTGSAEVLANAFTRNVLRRSMETTDEMKSEAQAQKDNVLMNFSQPSGDYSREALNATLKTMGYSGTDDLEELMTNYLKQDKLVEDYVTKNFDALKIRSISYILIRPEQTETPEDDVAVEGDDSVNEQETAAEVNVEPTEDEKKRMDAVDEMLKESTFADTAKKYSEDTSTASTGGILGVIDKNSNGYDEAFLKAALELNEGETSEWVHSANFGYFRIHCNANSRESIEKFYKEVVLPVQKEASTNNAENSEAVQETPTETAAEPGFLDVFSDLIYNNDYSLINTAIWEKGKELGVKFATEEIENSVKNYMGVK